MKSESPALSGALGADVPNNDLKWSKKAVPITSLFFR